MEEELHALASQAQDIHGRMVRGTSNEFDRARLLRDMQALATGLHRQAGRARELSHLIVSLGEDGPTHPTSPLGGRAA
jgi:hypothetical protein